MTVSFNIEYRTSWGEEVRIAGLLPESIPMHTTDGIYWTADVELEVPKEGIRWLERAEGVLKVTYLGKEEEK